MSLSLTPFFFKRIVAPLLLISFGSGVLATQTSVPLGSSGPTSIESPENTQNESEQTEIALEKAAKQEQFLMLQKAFEEQRFASLSPEQTLLNNFVLDGYVKAWSILTRSKLAKIDPTLEKEAQDFLAKNQNQYVAERFQTDWLKAIAPLLHEQKRWGEFESLRGQLAWNRDEPEFDCWSLYHDLDQTPTNNHARLQKIERQTLETLKSARHARLEVCQKLSRLMIEKIPSSAFARMVVLIQQGRINEAQTYVDFLIEKNRLPKKAKEALSNAPRWYKKNVRSLHRQDKYVALIAAYQLSRSDYPKAVKIAEKLTPRLSAQEKAALWGRIGYVAALDHDPKALIWYDKGGKNVCSGPYMAHSEGCLEWRVRSALRQTQWTKVNAFISQLPKDLKQKEAWIYWRGYALKQLGSPKAAQNEFAKLKNVRTFYGKLAAEQRHVPIVYQTTGATAASQDSIKTWSSNKHFLRATEFYDLGLLHYGHREWNWGIRDASALELLAAAQWAQQKGIWHRMINTSERVAERLPIEHELLYPKPYQALIENYSKINNIRDDWVYGLIRQESRFISIAKSNVGANGLMQIMPATATWIANNLNVENFDPSSIYEANTNIQFGTAYLRTLLDRLDQNMVLATAGYNAGPNRAKQWRASLTKPVEGAIFIETIPFTETRGYVQNVMANMVEYAQTSHQPIKRLSEIIGTISPKPIDAKDTI